MIEYRTDSLQIAIENLYQCSPDYLREELAPVLSGLYDVIKDLQDEVKQLKEASK